MKRTSLNILCFGCLPVLYGFPVLDGVSLLMGLPWLIDRIVMTIWTGIDRTDWTYGLKGVRT